MIDIFLRFLDFGRGKNIPLTPDNDNLEQIRIKSNTGRIVIDKTISEKDLTNNIFSSLNETPDGGRYVIDKNGKIIEKKKKGRLYSLGGNEPKKQSHLVRMKTVGTFDLCMEVTALACGFNQDILTIQEPAEELEKFDEKLPQVGSISISPKRQRHISSSDNSFSFDDGIDLSIKKKPRSLSSNSVLKDRGSPVEFRSKSADLLDTTERCYGRDLDELCSVSAADICKESIKKPAATKPAYTFKNKSKTDMNVKGGDNFKYQESKVADPVSVRRRTFKKSKKIIRTDSELIRERILTSTEASPVYHASTLPKKKSSMNEGSDQEYSSRNISTDTVFSDVCEKEEQIDLEKLENEYKEHIKTNLQREYKSDGDSLDEIGKERHFGLEWKNQSVDFEYLENDEFADELRVKSLKAGFVKSQKKIRNDSDNRTKSEGDKDTLYSKADSTETQSTEDENKIEVEAKPEVANKIEKHQSLFEKRFGKLKKMNKLLKVKRFSTSALYDKRKASEPNASKLKENQVPVLTALSQVSDFASSKTSLASPKSLKGKRFLLKKRKFSFFGKSQSNNDLNLNLKSLASKLTLISKSNFDLSKNSSNLRLNAVGIYAKYGASNEYRSDIISKQPGCTSP